MVRCMFCSPLSLQFRDVIPIPIPFHSFLHFLSFPLKTDPPCFINLTVPRPELRSQRINLPAHPPPPTIRHIHPRSRRPTRRVLTPGTVALRGNRTRTGGTDLSPVRVDALRKGTFLHFHYSVKLGKGGKKLIVSCYCRVASGFDLAKHPTPSLHKPLPDGFQV